jgi:hypothetical protein
MVFVEVIMAEFYPTVNREAFFRETFPLMGSA